MSEEGRGEKIRKKINGITAKLFSSNSSSSVWPAIHNYASQGKLDNLKEEIKKNPDSVNSQIEDGTTPLYLAAQNGHANIITELLLAEAKPGLARKDGSTPLIAAVSKNQTDVVKLLVGAGVDVNQAKNTGSTPLYVAAQNGSMAIVKVLLEDGKADVNKGKQGATPADIAKAQGHSEIVDYLCASGGKLSATPTTESSSKSE